MKNPLSIEVLESRIAPAVLFIANNASLGQFEVETSVGTPVTGDATAAGNMGANLAIHLYKGDSLVFDVNDNHVVDAGVDVLLMKVKSGQAIAFLTDFEGDGVFQQTNFSGLAVGDFDGKSFSGQGDAGVNGDISTTLDSSGNFTPGELQHASIAGLKLTGHVGNQFEGTGNILAGGSISKITIKNPTGPSSGQSVGGVIATGMAVSNYVGLSFQAVEGENGGDITGIKLASGVFGIYAGSAVDVNDDGDPETASVAPGRGGSISKVALGIGSTYHIEAGTGGGSNELPGGAGGSISDVKGGTFVYGDYLTVLAGAGGYGTVGGNGGSIAKVSLSKTGDGGVNMAAGNGGDGFFGNGGSGGSITKASLSTSMDGQEIFIHAGSGGMAGGDPEVDSFNGGKGGSISGLKVTSTGTSLFSPLLAISGGNGGGGTGAGGDGGAVDTVGLKLLANVGSLTILGGIGGDGYSSAGAGGGVSGLKINMLGSQGVEFVGGNGGIAYGIGGVAGAGGSVNDVTFANAGYIGYMDGPAGLGIRGGLGGEAYSEDGKGGAGGAVTNLKLKNTGGISSLAIVGGAGGAGIAGSGNGGSVAHVAFAGAGALGSVFSEQPGLVIYGGESIGDGGYGPTMGLGGSGGGVSDVLIKHTGVGTSMTIGGGFGSHSDGPDAIGGAGGSVSSVTITAPGSSVNVFGGMGGYAMGSEPLPPEELEGLAADLISPAIAGAGGSVSALTIKTGLVTVFAGQGGDSYFGQAGAGGDVSTLALTVSSSARIIAAGDGGSTSLGIVGNGGSISSVTVAGDIGDFSSSEYYYYEIESRFTGLIAGAAGGVDGIYSNAGNGSITGVTATRISAIYAGLNRVLTITGDFDSTNAVAQITGLATTVLGADRNGDHAFTFSEGDSDLIFQLPDDVAADGDSTTEGLVIVKAGGFVIPSSLTPLKVIEV